MNNIPASSIKQIWSLNSAPRVIKLFGNCCKNYIFETGLETPDYRFDLSLCVLKEEIDPLLQYWQQNDLTRIFKSNPTWKNIYRFCQLWGNRDSILAKHIANLWFEFDDLELNALYPRPCLFFSPTGMNRSFTLDKTHNISRLYDTALSTLYGNTLTETIKKNIQRCIDALPGTGAIFQIGAMIPRKMKSVRLCTVMPLNDYTSYLQEIGWRGSFDYLKTLLESLARLADGIFVDIDIWEEILPKAGIECVYKNSTNREPGGNDLKVLLEYLTGLNLCIKDKADRITDWINGQLEEHEDGSCVKRSLSHIKVVLHPDNSIEAKAYPALSMEIKKGGPLFLFPPPD